MPGSGCYGERYRLTGSAVAGLAAGLLALSLAFVWHTQAIFRVVSAAVAKSEYHGPFGINSWKSTRGCLPAVRATMLPSSNIVRWRAA